MAETVALKTGDDGRGLTRVSASRLHEISQGLRMPVGCFYEGMGAPRALNAHERMTMEMVRTFGAIGDPHLQEALGNLARTPAAPGTDDSETAV